MTADSPIQPCPRCLKSTVLVDFPSGRRWVHFGTDSSQCGNPTWLDDDAVPVRVRRQEPPQAR